MAETKEQRLAREIYENVGGMSNVKKIIHCMTRVRMTIKDDQKVNMDALKAVDGVLGVVEDETLQVIVGPGIVNKVANIMVSEAGVKLGAAFPEQSDKSGRTLTDREIVEAKAAEVKAREKAKHNNSTAFKRVLKSISNIFVPLIPAFVGAGIIGGIAAIFSNLLTAGSIGPQLLQH
jgi:PTS system sucrose-specific IIC component